MKTNLSPNFKPTKPIILIIFQQHKTYFFMKKFIHWKLYLSALFIFCMLLFIPSCRKDKVIPTEPIPEGTIVIPSYNQRTGDPVAGYDYLVNGDYIKSGIPIDIFTSFFGSDDNNELGRSGDNATINYQYTATNATNGVRIVAPNCLQCHAQKINGELIVGLGNSMYDFTVNQANGIELVGLGIATLYGANSPEVKASEDFIKVTSTIGEHLITDVIGANPADKLAAVLAAHRNPEDLVWSDDPMLPIPSAVIPTDVPPFWLLKKKNAMFYNAVGRQDFARFMMASNLLTVVDTSEAREVDNRFKDVLAYIMSIEAPAYPESIDMNLADEGLEIFERKCQNCHGQYGANESYPNLLIPTNAIGTDPLVASTYQDGYDDFVNWYNMSWFATNPNAASIQPEDGYIAPPLDGIWASAPYLHNGAVPTLEDLLNSSQRPTFWERSFDDSDLDYQKVGWNYVVKNSGNGNTVYDTTLPGYGNQGHVYGDDLEGEERKALIEYLKTL